MSIYELRISNSWSSVRIYCVGYIPHEIFMSGIDLMNYSYYYALRRDHLDLLERNNQLILELKHLDSTPAQRYCIPQQ